MPEELAGAYLLLASDVGKNINGAGIVVGECDERDVAEIDALLRSHAAKEVSVVEA